MKALHGIRVLSLALNLPGPAALQRLRLLGARCVKLEPPPPADAPAGGSADPMQQYAPQAYAALHEGIRIVRADLKSARGQQRLQQALARSDLLLTSFRPSALKRLGLAWPTLHRQHPQLSLVSIVGWPSPQAEVPGHDLTYMAENGLINGLQQPASLFADMAGALLASEAALQALLRRQASGRGTRLEVALAAAADWLAQPRHWGLTNPARPAGLLSGRHAGYRLYACRDGRVAVAALEPHFFLALCTAAGLDGASATAGATHAALEAWFARQTRRTLDRLAQQQDLPLHTLPRD